MWRSIFISKIIGHRPATAGSTDTAARCPYLKRLDRLGLGDFGAALFARASFVVVPEIEHGLAEMIHDIGAIEIDVFHDRAAVFAVKDDVLVFVWRPAALDDDADGVGRANRSVRDIRRNEKRFALPDQMIDDLVALADPDFDVALELVKIFLRIDEVEIVPRVRTFDDHDKKVAAVVEVAIADGRLEQIAIRFDPVVDVYRRQHFASGAAADGLWW